MFSRSILKLYANSSYRVIFNHPDNCALLVNNSSCSQTNQIAFKQFQNELRKLSKPQQILNQYNRFRSKNNSSKIANQEQVFGYTCKILDRLLRKGKLNYNVVTSLLGKKGETLLKMDPKLYKSNQQRICVLNFIKSLLQSQDLNFLVHQWFKDKKLEQAIKEYFKQILKKEQDQANQVNLNFDMPFGKQANFQLLYKIGLVSQNQKQTIQIDRIQFQTSFWLRVCFCAKILHFSDQFNLIIKSKIHPWLQDPKCQINAFRIVQLISLVQLIKDYSKQSEADLQQITKLYILCLRYLLQKQKFYKLFQRNVSIIDELDLNQKALIIKSILHFNKQNLLSNNNQTKQLSQKLLNVLIIDHTRNLYQLRASDIIIILEVFFKFQVLTSNQNKKSQIMGQQATKSAHFLFLMVYKTILQKAIFQANIKTQNNKVFKIPQMQIHSKIQPLVILKILSILPAEYENLIQEAISSDLKGWKWKQKAIRFYDKFFSEQDSNLQNYSTLKHKWTNPQAQIIIQQFRSKFKCKDS